MTPPRSERWIPWLFALVAVVLPLQFWFARANPRGEPYPAILLPAFDRVATDADGRVLAESVTIVVRFADGTIEPLPLRTLFARAPSSHIMAMAQIALKPKPEHPAEAKDSRLREWLKRYVAPGLALSTARRHYWSGPDPGTVSWLRARVQELFPDRRPSRIGVEWYVDRYEWQADRWVRQRDRTASLELPL
ncbi:MAG TPA: hypothetical protein VFT36_09255 [Methylomirabilota bacterium]|nr:hypothetical protein [Methylomirabilota bacterium]